MASVDTGGGGEVKKGKPKKLNLRVDFTPMVDMNMLLITFFMFCTTLSKPQAMDLVLPTNDKNIEEQDQNKVPDDKVITVLLGEKDKVYYYFGKPDYKDFASLKQTDYSAEGLRKMLLERNASAVSKMRELRKQKMNKQVSEEQFKEESKKIRNDKNGQIVIIKPTEGASYANLVDVLDEMQICSVGKYAIVEVTDGDLFLIQNLETKGAFGQGRQ